MQFYQSAIMKNNSVPYLRVNGIVSISRICVNVYKIS